MTSVFEPEISKSDKNALIKALDKGEISKHLENQLPI